MEGLRLSHFQVVTCLLQIEKDCKKVIAHEVAIPDGVSQVNEVVKSGFVPSNPMLGIQKQTFILQEPHKLTICHTHSMVFNTFLVRLTGLQLIGKEWPFSSMNIRMIVAILQAARKEFSVHIQSCMDSRN
jgi:hypothetical protein